jgi:hypothetical protein
MKLIGFKYIFAAFLTSANFILFQKGNIKKEQIQNYLIREIILLDTLNSVDSIFLYENNYKDFKFNDLPVLFSKSKALRLKPSQKSIELFFQIKKLPESRDSLFDKLRLAKNNWIYYLSNINSNKIYVCLLRSHSLLKNGDNSEKLMGTLWWFEFKFNSKSNIEIVKKTYSIVDL